MGSFCIAKAINSKCDKVLRCFQIYSVDSGWTDSSGNSLLHLVFMDYCLDFRLKLDMAARLVSIGSQLDLENFEKLTPLQASIKEQSRMNFNVLLAVELNEIQV